MLSTQADPLPLPPVTHCINTNPWVLIHTGGGGGDKGEGLWGRIGQQGGIMVSAYKHTIRPNAGSGSALHQCGSETLRKEYFHDHCNKMCDFILTLSFKL